MASGITFDEIAWLRANSPAWRLLRADSAPLVLSFLHRVFVEENIRSISASELFSQLDDELYALNERTPRSFPNPAKAHWASPECGWLRKYYPEGTDEPHFDATPAVERARGCEPWASAHSSAPSPGSTRSSTCSVRSSSARRPIRGLGSMNSTAASVRSRRASRALKPVT